MKITPYEKGRVLSVRVSQRNGGGYIVRTPENMTAFLPLSHAPSPIPSGAFAVAVLESHCDAAGKVLTTVSAKGELGSVAHGGSAVGGVSSPAQLKAIASVNKAGDIVSATVTCVRPSYAIVELAKGQSALLHISELCVGGFVADINAVIKVGDRIIVRVMKVDVESGKTYVSKRAVETGCAKDRTGGYEKIPVPEGSTVEFKSSILFDPATSALSPTQPLRIAKVLAAFMNCSGGELFIGVKDSGIIIGCENDLAHLGEVAIESETLRRSDAGWTYPSTVDGYKRKIRAAIQTHLGAYACSLMEDPEAKYDTAGRLYVRIAVRPAPKAKVICCGEEGFVFVRTGDETTHLKGRDLVEWLLARTAA